jgi:16S rRNA (cytidine1402-2'-O)-methyltransferase
MNPTASKGKLYLIPNTLGETNPMDVLPQTVKRTIDLMDNFIVENEKDARKFIKSICPEKVQATLKLSSLNKRTEKSEHFAIIKPCLEGENIGLMSDAGCPGVADPRCDCKIGTRKRHSSSSISRSFIDFIGPNGLWNERKKFCVQRLFTH